MTLLQHCELESCYGKEIIIQYEKLSDSDTLHRKIRPYIILYTPDISCHCG